MLPNSLITRIAFISVIVLFCIGLILLVITGNMDSGENEKSSDRIIEIENITLEGWHDKQIIWHIQARYGWSGLQKNYANMENLYNGTLYDYKGSLLVDNLVAANGRGNSSQEWLEAWGGVSGILYMSSGKSRRQMTVNTNKLVYNASIKKSFVEGGVTLNYEKGQIIAKEGEINHEKEMVMVETGFHIIDANSDVQAQILEIDLNSEIANIRIDVKLQTYSDPVTRADLTILTCSNLKWYLADENNNHGDFYGSVIINQNQYRLKGESGSFNENEHIMRMRDKVELLLRDKETVIQCQKLDITTLPKSKEIKTAIFKGQLIISEKNKTIHATQGRYDKTTNVLTLEKDVQLHIADIHQEYNRVDDPIADSKTGTNSAEIYCDLLTLERDSHNALAKGNVWVVQNDQEATGENAIYDEITKVVYMTENVHTRKANGQWMRADKVTVYLKEEIFEAQGEVESEFKIRRKKR